MHRALCAECKLQFKSNYFQTSHVFKYVFNYVGMFWMMRGLTILIHQKLLEITLKIRIYKKQVRIMHLPQVKIFFLQNVN